MNGLLENSHHRHKRPNRDERRVASHKQVFRFLHKLTQQIGRAAKAWDHASCSFPVRLNDRDCSRTVLFLSAALLCSVTIASINNIMYGVHNSTEIATELLVGVFCNIIVI